MRVKSLTNGNHPNTHPNLYCGSGNETFSKRFITTRCVGRDCFFYFGILCLALERNGSGVLFRLAHFVCLLSLAHTHSQTRTAPKESESRRKPQPRASQNRLSGMTGDMHIHQKGKGERQPAQQPPTHQQTNTHTTNEPFCGLYVRSDVL
jgi:hypothetical protein